MLPLLEKHKILCLRRRTIPTINGTVKSMFRSGNIDYTSNISFLIHKVTEIATFFSRNASSKEVMKTLEVKAFVSSQNFKYLEIRP